MKKIFTLLGGAVLASMGAYALQAAGEGEATAPVVDFQDVFLGSMPSNEEPIDPEEVTTGVGYLNLMLGGDLTLNDGVNPTVRLYCDGSLVNYAELNEDCLMSLGGAGGFEEGDDVDPGMTGGGMTLMVIDFEDNITDPGTYTLRIPENLLVQADGTTVGAGEVVYTIAGAAGKVEFADVFLGSMPSNEEPIDLNEYSMGVGYLNLVFGGALEVNKAVSENESLLLYRDGKCIDAIALTEDMVMSDGGSPLSEDDEVDPSMTLGNTYIELDFDKEYTEAGEYTLEFPAGVLKYSDGTLVGEGKIVYTIAAPASVVPLEDVVLGSMPAFGEPIDLEEYPLGAGFINLVLGGKVIVNEAVAKYDTVALYYEGEMVNVCPVIADNIVYLDEASSPFNDDEVDPGMGEIYSSVLELDFDEAYTQPGTYALVIPEGILMYEDGTLIGGNEIVYEIEQNFAPVAVDITPRPFDEGLDNTVDKLTRFTVSVSSEDYTALTVTEDAFIELYNPNDPYGWYQFLTLEAEQIDDTTVRLSLPFGLYVPGTYTLSIYTGSLVATQLDGTEVPVQNIIEDYVIGEGDPIAFEDLLLWSEPVAAMFDEKVDLAENPEGLSYLAFMTAGHWAYIDGAEGEITLSKDGEVVATSDMIEVMDQFMSLPPEDDNVDPGFGMSEEYSIVMPWWDEFETEVGTYTVSIPDGLFWANNCKVLGSEIEYVVIDSETGVESAFGATEGFNVVDLQGRVILRNAKASDVNALAKGLYIINGKVVKK